MVETIQERNVWNMKMTITINYVEGCSEGTRLLLLKEVSKRSNGESAREERKSAERVVNYSPSFSGEEPPKRKKSSGNRSGVCSTEG